MFGYRLNVGIKYEFRLRTDFRLRTGIGFVEIVFIL